MSQPGRMTIYPNEVGSTAKVLQMQRDSYKALFQFIADSLGNTSSYFTGLAATPGTGLSVSIGRGALYQYLANDPTTWSTLAADTTPYELQAILEAAATVTLSPPAMTSGQSVNILIEAQVQVQDATASNTNFYNSSNPLAPTPLARSNTRSNVVVLQAKNGTPATTGLQTSPAADAGWVPLWVITVDQGEVSINSGDIAAAAGAPQFYGFVQVNPAGNTPVFLNPASQQTGSINISGQAQIGAANSNNALLAIRIPNASVAAGSTKQTALFSYSVDGASNVSGITPAAFGVGDSGAAALLALDLSGNLGLKGALSLNGGITYTGTHAGTDADPYPTSQVNAAMFGGKLPSDYALASGSYVTLYAGTPTLGSGNAGVTGYLQSGVATGTAPLIVASTTQVANLNCSLLAGYAAGHSSGQIPIADGTLCTNLNAQYLNGLPSSAFQVAGSYAVLNALSSGYIQASGTVGSTGGQPSTQIQMGYAATNSQGLNSNGPISYLQALATPLALLGSAILTNGPLYLGQATKYNLYAQDVVASGVIRQGMPLYRVTKLASYSANSGPFPVGSPGAVDLGYYASATGHISLMLPGAGTWDFRMVLTLSANLTVNFNGRHNDAFAVWVDGVNVFTATSDGNIAGSYTFSAGQHTIDVIYGADGVAADDRLDLFGWIPYPAGSMAAAITSILPG